MCELLRRRSYSSDSRDSRDCSDSSINIDSTNNDEKLDGVGPVDNRPSTDKLLHFVKKKK